MKSNRIEGNLSKSKESKEIKGNRRKSKEIGGNQRIAKEIARNHKKSKDIERNQRKSKDIDAHFVEIILKIIKNVWNICKPTEIWPTHFFSHHDWAFKSLKGSTFAKPDRCTKMKHVLFQVPRWPRKTNLLIVIAQKNLLIVIASKNKFTNRDCPMVTQTCRRTETLLNLGQMNGSSTS